MKQWSKLAMTAGAIGVIGVAGSFGTYSAFTAQNAPKTVDVHSGTIKVDNNFQLPDLTNLGTRDTTWNCDGNTGRPTGSSECWGGTGPDASKRAGYIDVQNTGSLPQDVYVDFDGVGKTGVTSPNLESGDVIADNLIIDSSYDSDFSTVGDAGTRLWVLNRRGPSLVATLQPGQAKRIYYRAHLRERFPGIYPGGDNEMQDKALSIPETVTVSAVEAGRDDLLVPAVTPGNEQGITKDPRDDGKRYDYGA
jgi:hypothetical protein